MQVSINYLGGNSLSASGDSILFNLQSPGDEPTATMDRLYIGETIVRPSSTGAMILNIIDSHNRQWRGFVPAETKTPVFISGRNPRGEIRVSHGDIVIPNIAAPAILTTPSGSIIVTIIIAAAILGYYIYRRRLR